MDFLYWVGLYYIVGLVYFAFVNHSNTVEEIDKPLVFYTLGLVFMTTLWLPIVILYLINGDEPKCKLCSRPIPKTKEGYVCQYCTT
jgi:hypothetical protein